MKIIHLNEVANVSSELTKGLCEYGMESEVYRLKFLAAKGEENRTFLKLFFAPYLVSQLIAFNKYVHKTAPDIVQIHVAYLGLAGIMGGYRYILHCHGWDLYMNLFRPTLRSLTIRCLKRAARVLYSTPNLKAYLDEIGIPGTFLPNPIDTNVFSPSSGQRNSRRQILINSRIESIKGIDVVFDVLKRFETIDPSLHFCCFNLGNRIDECRKFRNLILMDVVDYSKMPGIINACDLVVGQFHLGAMGMAELEAMSCAKPVVAYFNCNDAYSDPPPILSSKDPSIIVELIRELIDNPVKCGLIGQKGREWVIKNHGLPLITKRLVEIYNSVFKKGDVR